MILNKGNGGVGVIDDNKTSLSKLIKMTASTWQ